MVETSVVRRKIDLAFGHDCQIETKIKSKKMNHKLIFFKRKQKTHIYVFTKHYDIKVTFEFNFEKQ